jgi:hypothetical protein
MDVYGRIFSAYLDTNKSMFDFHIAFLIANPRMKDFEAFYYFNKVANPSKEIKTREAELDDDKQSDQVQNFLGHDDFDTNEKKPYHFDRLTGLGTGRSVDAQVTMLSSDKKKFTVTVSLTKKKDHSVTVSFQGAAPSWLARDKAVFSGKLMMGEVKDLRPKKLPGL